MFQRSNVLRPVLSVLVILLLSACAHTTGAPTSGPQCGGMKDGMGKSSCCCAKMMEEAHKGGKSPCCCSGGEHGTHKMCAPKK